MQFTLGITGDLLTNEGNPCFGGRPLEALYKQKKILVEWMDPNIKILSEKETSKYDAILFDTYGDEDYGNFVWFAVNKANKGCKITWYNPKDSDMQVKLNKFAVDYKRAGGDLNLGFTT